MWHRNWKRIIWDGQRNYSNIEIDEDEFKAVDASKIYAETIGKTPPVQAEAVAEEPKDESSLMNGAQSETVSVSDSSESSPEDDNPEMSDMETAKQISSNLFQRYIFFKRFFKFGTKNAPLKK